MFMNSFGFSFFSAAVVLLISCIYIKLYDAVRKTEFTQIISRRQTFFQLVLCFLFNLLIFVYYPIQKSLNINALFFLVSALMADVDIMIRKIPTEFLAAEAVLMSFVIGGLIDPVFLFFCAACCVILILFREKIGLALYDALVIGILSAGCISVSKMLYFYALFLILWGSMGMILRIVIHRNQKATIPLAPAIIAAFIITQLLP